MWFSKNWPWLLAFLLQGESLWKLLKWALDWRGRYDALAATYHEVGGIGAMIGYILDAPPWFYPTAFVAGLILIWWNFHPNRQQAAVARDSTPRGTKLITAGVIVLIVGIMGGMVLIISGIYQNSERRSEAPNAVGEPTKTPLAQSAPAPVEAPVLQPSPEPIPEAQAVPPPAPAPSPPPPIPPAKPPKEFVDVNVTPEFLAGLYEGQTTLGAETRTSKYIGKWMPVSGPMGETVGGYPFLSGRSPVVASFSSRQGPSVIMIFHDEWIDRLAMIAKNQTIAVYGQITKVERDKIVLDYCELVDSDPTTNAPKPSPNSPARPRRRRPPKGKRPSQG